MTAMTGDVDPVISEHVIAIRNRFGILGLQQAADLIALEIAIFGDVDSDLVDE